jgi:membrane fusion protein (multidrug efflux system)
MRNLRTLIFAVALPGTIAFCVSCGGHSASPESKADAPTAATQTPTLEVAPVESRKLAITVRLPGELQPYEAVAVFPKVTGFVDSITVDRGSVVKTGQLMIRLVAPELAAQRAEAQSKLQGAEAQRIEAEATLAAHESTYQRLKRASATPGVVAGNDLEVAQKAVDADRARVQSARESAEAAKAALKSVTEIEGYLQVRAPLDGVVTERNVHPGTLVGSPSGSGPSTPLVRVETTGRLRLVVPVPEKYVAGVTQGGKVQFSVPAYPNQTFSGTVARIAHSIEPKTRTMPVELDVNNSDRRLAAGMFPEVLWPIKHSEATLFVPVSAVARTMEATFVVRIRDGKAEWVNVHAGELDGKTIEIFGELRAGDQVALRGTDELRPGTRVMTKTVSADVPGSKK